jgi:hypothetical protein
MLLASILCASLAPSAMEICAGEELPHRCGTTWNANIDLGYGKANHEGIGLLKASGGVLYIDEPNFYALNVMAEILTKQPAAFGVQGEINHLWSGF